MPFRLVVLCSACFAVLAGFVAPASANHGRDAWDALPDVTLPAEDDVAGEDVWTGDEPGDDRPWGDTGVPEVTWPEEDEQEEPELPREGGAVPLPVRPPVQEPALPTVPVRRTIPGKVARLRTDGKAAIPRGAPKRVRQLIAAANQIVGKPYKWGGGHARLIDSGYDCSGAVSYALIRSGMLASPLVSGQLARWSSAGAGRWLTVYANKGHVYLEVAGLRLDTSPVGDPTRRRGVRWRPAIGRRPGFAVRHVAGL